MLFPSPVFLFIFLPLLLAVYYAMPQKVTWRNVVLLVASLFFYAWGEPLFVFVLLLSVLVNYAFGSGISHCQSQGKRGRGYVVAAVVFNVALLFIFKYLNFAVDSINQLFGTAWVVRHIALPVGISFFTFQSLSYVIDIYRSRCVARSGILDVGLYVTLFPQLIAGPIVRYETIMQELTSRRATLSDFSSGVELFVQGLAKKVLIANNVAVIADTVYALPDSRLSGAAAWLGAVAYMLQIYFDFSGYSDMAIGLGRMFGFHFLKNFDYPYVSRSASEFWRRWHISLGTWFRDYLYIPLGGSRRGLLRTVANLFVVWALTGLWHGANYTFVCWGLMFFVAISFEKVVRFERWRGGLLRWGWTMLLVLCGFVLFRSETIGDAVTHLRAMFSGGAPDDGITMFLLHEHLVALLVGLLLSFPVARWGMIAAGRWRYGNWVKFLLLAVLLFVSVSYVVRGAYSPFIYFNF